MLFFIHCSIFLPILRKRSRPRNKNMMSLTDCVNNKSFFRMVFVYFSLVCMHPNLKHSGLKTHKTIYFFFQPELWNSLENYCISIYYCYLKKLRILYFGPIARVFHGDFFMRQPESKEFMSDSRKTNPIKTDCFPMNFIIPNLFPNMLQFILRGLNISFNLKRQNPHCIFNILFHLSTQVTTFNAVKHELGNGLSSCNLITGASLESIE